MIDLYSWPTPNGLTISILLEEAGIEHRAPAGGDTAISLFGRKP